MSSRTSLCHASLMFALLIGVSSAVAQPATITSRARVEKSLRSRLGNQIDVAFGRDGSTVILLRLPANNRYRGKETETIARKFLSAVYDLLDPSIQPSEYRVSTDERSCDDRVVTFDRYADGRRVVGSKLTIRFDRDNALREVINGVAPVPSTILPALPSASTIPYPAMRTPVLVPERGGLRTADMRVWTEPEQNGYRIAFSGSRERLSYRAGLPFGKDGSKPDVLVDPRTDLPQSLSFYATNGLPVLSFAAERNPAEIVYRFLDEHPSLFRTGAPRCQFGVKSITRSPALPNISFVRIEQQYLGIPVSGAELVFDISDSGRVMSVSGHVLPSIHLNPTPALTKEQAVTAAKTTFLRLIEDKPELAPLRDEIAAAVAQPDLVIFPGTIADQKQKDRLAYRMSLGPAGVYVDAENGEILYSYGTRAGQSVNDGLTLPEVARSAYVPIIVRGVPTGVTPNADVLPAAAAIASTRAFFSALGWNGQDGAGAPYVMNTNVGMMFGCPNAFFDIFVTREAYACIGVGLHPDVVAHELTHGIIAASSGLIYANESGALHEAYADLFGSLVFPDAAPASGGLPGWLIGEPSAAGGTAFGTAALRNMNPPGSFNAAGAFTPDPGTLGAYLDRNAPGSGCSVLPWSCDFGFVHRNNGIVNQAHVILSDGIPGVTLPGIGRAKVATLAFLVMTTRLTPFARLGDVALATRELAVALSGTGFLTLAEADQVPIAFRLVGLDPSMTTGWSEPAFGFAGTDVFFGSGETTTSGCAITNVRAILDTPIIGPTTIDLAPGTVIPPSVNLFVHGISFAPPPAGAAPPPIGSTSKLHGIAWFDIYGEKPHFTTDLIEALPPAGVSCFAGAPSFPVERTTGSITRSAILGGTSSDTIGNATSAISSSCAVRQTLVELLDGAGNVITAPGRAVTDTVVLFRIFGFPVTSTRTATITALPGPRPPNLSATVVSTFGIGTFARFRLRYIIDQRVTGPACIP